MKFLPSRKLPVLLIAAISLTGWLAWAFGWEETFSMRRDLSQLEDLNGILLADVGHFKEQAEKRLPPPSPAEKEFYALRDRMKTQENMIADLRSHNDGLQKKLGELHAVSQSSGTSPDPSASVDLGTLAVSPGGAAYAEGASGTALGRVVTVDDKKAFVVIDVGRKAGIDKGMRFSAAKGNAQVAELEVIELRDSHSACRVSYADPQNTLRPNDEIRLSRKK